MASVLDMDITFAVKLRHGTVINSCKSCLGEDEIQLCEDLKICCDRLDIRDEFSA